MIKAGNSSTIALMMDGVKRFDEEIAGIYTSFARQREQSLSFCRPYKEAEKIHRDQMREIKKKHRNMIKLSQSTMQEALASGALKLAEELQDALCKPIPQAFLRMFEAYVGTDMQPGKAELEAFSCLAERHPSAYRMIDVLCEQTGAKYRVKHPAVEDFEQDIEYIGKYGLLFDLPLTRPEQLDLSIALFAGKNASGFTIEPVPKMTAKATGEVIQGVGDRLVPDTNEPGTKMNFLNPDGKIEQGADWDVAHLSAAQITFKELEKRLSDMKSRWSGGVYPIEKAESDEAVELAKEMGRETREQAEATVPESMKL